MSKTISMVVASILLAIGAPALHGVARATEVHGSVGIELVDVWQFQCTSSATACIRATVCDAVSSSPDDWIITMDVYSPTVLLGKGDTGLAETGECATVGVCRVPPSHGPIKALVNINHPGGGSNSDTYNLTGECLDGTGGTLPNNSTKLTIKTND